MKTEFLTMLVIVPGIFGGLVIIGLLVAAGIKLRKDKAKPATGTFRPINDEQPSIIVTSRILDPPRPEQPHTDADGFQPKGTSKRTIDWVTGKQIHE